MVQIDGGMTLFIDAMIEITTQLDSFTIMPMQRHSKPIYEFITVMGDSFVV